MKPAMNKQTALKLTLLLALVANISGGVAYKTFNLSSETVSSQPTAPAAKTAAEKSAEKSDKLPLNQTAAQEVAGEPSPVTESPKYCGERVYITYREISVTKDGKKETNTEIYVKPHTGGTSQLKAFKIIPAGGFKTNLEDKDVKSDNDKKIAEIIKQRIGHCDVEEASATIVRPEEPISKDDKVALKKAVKECRLTEKGSPLTEVQKTRCRLKQLSDIDAGEDDSRGKAKALRELETLVKGDLRRAIKNRLMSTDESKIEEGEELLSEVVDQIKDMGTELNLDQRRTSRLVGEIQALRPGGETYRRALDLEKDVKEATTDLRQQAMDAQQNCRDQGQLVYQQCMLTIQRDAIIKQQEIQTRMQMDITNGSYAQMTNAAQMGLLPLSDFNQFTQPYQQLRRDLSTQFDPRMYNGMGIGGYNTTPGYGGPMGPGYNNQLPSDFNNYRSGLATSMQRNYGAAVPQMRPNISALFNQQMPSYNGAYGLPNTTQYSIPNYNPQPYGQTYQPMYQPTYQQQPYQYQQRAYQAPLQQQQFAPPVQMNGLGGNRW